MTTQTEQLPTDVELAIIDELFDTTVDTDNVDDWVDSMMMGIIEDIQY